MTSDLQTLLELYSNKAYFYEAYEGFKTLELCVMYRLTFYRKYLLYFSISARVLIFNRESRNCDRLSLLLEELDQKAAALHSFKSQSLRLSSLHRFKSGQASILLATDVTSRGLDIPTVDLVINYDIPMNRRDYVHRVGRTTRAGRGGLSVSFVSQNDVILLHGFMQSKLILESN
ncbi:hypothetical protein EZV62_006255 [Acer yangbiense]|uniref:Helicase C-terminal domain-containing protein n=1 Tax=Acer yangbiense TaxID=1000413 RepID=A0A5C7IPY9_9ROSI|nr:hypothetical protein EZV62_006255 [Acer yangbiense]